MILYLAKHNVPSSVSKTVGVVCTLSSNLQVMPFSDGPAYTFGGVCDHWVIAPTVVAATGLTLSVAVTFSTDQTPTTINTVKVRYGNLEVVSTSSGELESNIAPLTRQDAPFQTIFFTFSNNVQATMGGEANSITIGDVSATVTHTHSQQGSQQIEVVFGESSLLLNALGLCGSVGGSLVVNGPANEAVDASDAAQLTRFSRSWILPAQLQTSTEESCSEYSLDVP